MSFSAGLFVGAVFALLFAPSSGEELRAQLREQATAEYERAQAELHRTQQQIAAKLDETMTEVKALIEKAQAEETAA